MAFSLCLLRQQVVDTHTHTHTHAAAAHAPPPPPHRPVLSTNPLIRSSHPQLVDKENIRSAVWKYFGFEVNDEGKAKDAMKPV